MDEFVESRSSFNLCFFMKVDIQLENVMLDTCREI